MPDGLAPNLPGGLLARIEALRYRLSFLGATPSPAQIRALGQVLATELKEAYRHAIQRESAKWGLNAYGPLDPYIAAQLEAEAQQVAQGVIRTYLRWRAAAQARGEDMTNWGQKYAQDRADLIQRYEYSRGDFRGLRDFYRHNDTLPATAHVEPRHGAVPDICRELIARGEIPLEIALQFCPRAITSCYATSRATPTWAWPLISP